MRLYYLNCRLPVLVLCTAGVASSFTNIRSRMLVWYRRMPACTKRFPFASGSVCTVPFRFMLRILTESPRRSFFGTLWLICSFFWIEDLDWAFAFFSGFSHGPFPWREASIWVLPYLWKLRMVSSARSLASFKIAAACWLASCNTRSRLRFKRSCFSSNCFFREAASSL